MEKEVYVINSKGEREPFSPEKVFFSVRRAGGSEQTANEIVSIIEKEIYNGIKTRDIYQKIKKLLQKREERTFLTFSLKEALLKMGPTGFPFEKFVGEIFKSQGFEISYNQKIIGFCNVIYEIDFIAKKENKIYLAECKYHHRAGERVNLRVVLANQARLEDIRENREFSKLRNEGIEIESIIITNTKFTTQAIQYAQCKKTNLLAWRYPENNGLETMIEKNKLYPITILPSLKGKIKDFFVKNNLMLVQDVFKKKIDLPKEIIMPLIQEANKLLEN